MAIVASLLCLCLPDAILAAEGTTLAPVEQWSNVFSGGEVKFHYAVQTAQDLDGRLDWSLSVNRRTVKHGQVPLRTLAQRAVEVTVALNLPEVNEGVVLQAQLTVAIYAQGVQKRLAQHDKPVWIFPRNPFHDRSDWLKRLKITLFDPEGKTADLLEKAHVPFTFTKNIAALDDLSQGLLVIGEGTPWQDYRSLGETAVKAAARGLPVLCLAPGEGALVLPGTAGAELPPPARLTLRQDDVIEELDRRLDAVAWPTKGPIDVSRLTIKSDRDQVVAEATKWPPARSASGAGGEGWPWLEIRYSVGKGRLLVCGFGIIRQWHATPTPRYVLSELFVRLAATKPANPLPQDERTELP